MATRFYFPASTAADVSPAYHTSWQYNSEAVRRRLSHTKGSSAIAVGSQIGPWTLTNYALDRQYVSDQMAGGIVFDSSVTVRGVLMVREYANQDNTNQVILCAKVVSSDGGTLRRNLIGPGSYYTPAEFINDATHRNKRFADGDALSPSSPYTTVAGDRLVVEIGYCDTGTGTTPEGSAKWGENATDCAENETNTTNAAGWIEFSNTITFGNIYSYSAVGGSVAGGTATIANIRVQSFSAIGGAVIGGISLLGLCFQGSGGAVAGGTAAFKSSGNLAGYWANQYWATRYWPYRYWSGSVAVENKFTGIGGAVAGGTAAITQIFTPSHISSGGGVAGGSAGQKNIRLHTATGGSVAGGIADYGIVQGETGGSFWSQRYWAQRFWAKRYWASEIVSGVHVYSYEASGGCVAGGSSEESRTYSYTSTSGGIAGGIATRSSVVSIATSGGGVAGGTASYSTTGLYSYTASGGAVAGGLATKSIVYAYSASSGGLVGGSAALAYSYIYRHASTGGAVAGGNATYAIGRQTHGGAVAGGSCGIKRIKSVSATSGGVAGGTASYVIVGTQSYSYSAIGGGVAGGSLSYARITTYAGAGGSVAGGSATVILIGAHIYTHIASGGAVAGGECLASSSNDPRRVHGHWRKKAPTVRMRIKVPVAELEMV